MRTHLRRIGRVAALTQSVLYFGLKSYLICNCWLSPSVCIGLTSPDSRRSGEIKFGRTTESSKHRAGRLRAEGQRRCYLAYRTSLPCCFCLLSLSKERMPGPEAEAFLTRRCEGREAETSRTAWGTWMRMPLPVIAVSAYAVVRTDSGDRCRDRRSRCACTHCCRRQCRWQSTAWCRSRSHRTSGSRLRRHTCRRDGRNANPSRR